MIIVNFEWIIALIYRKTSFFALKVMFDHVVYLHNWHTVSPLWIHPVFGVFGGSCAPRLTELKVIHSKQKILQFVTITNVWWGIGPNQENLS